MFVQKYVLGNLRGHIFGICVSKKCFGKWREHVFGKTAPWGQEAHTKAYRKTNRKIHKLFIELGGQREPYLMWSHPVGCSPEGAKSVKMSAAKRTTNTFSKYTHSAYKRTTQKQQGKRKSGKTKMGK